MKNLMKWFSLLTAAFVLLPSTACNNTTISNVADSGFETTYSEDVYSEESTNVEETKKQTKPKATHPSVNTTLTPLSLPMYLTLTLSAWVTHIT